MRADVTDLPVRWPRASCDPHRYRRRSWRVRRGSRVADELLAGAGSRVVVDPGDARSGSSFERVTIDGQPFFAKTLGYRTDWIMRVTGDRDLRTLKIWRAGIMRDARPRSITRSSGWRPTARARTRCSPS